MAQVPYSPGGGGTAGDFVEPTGPSGALLNVQASPNAFGAGIGQATQKLGAAAEQAGQQGAEVALARQHLTNELYANDANTAGVQRITDEYTNFNRLEGRAAYEALPAFNDKVNQIYHETLAKAPNDQARAMLSQSMRYASDAWIRYGTNYADTQWKQWQNKSRMDGAANYANQAALSLNNPRDMDTNIFLSGDQIRALAEQKGMAPEEADAEVAKNTGAIVNNIARQMADGGRLQDASALVDRYAPQMDKGSLLSVKTVLRTKLLDATAASKTQGYLALGGSAAANGALAPVQSQPAFRTAADAIKDQEGGPQSNVWQIQPDTFKRYAQAGENVANPADNEAVGRRIVSDLERKYPNDPARVAVGYFSGEGNIAPAGSPTPWLRDAHDKNGKSTSGYVQDILAKLGAPMPKMDQSAILAKAMDDNKDNPELQRRIVTDLNREFRSDNLRAASLKAAQDEARVSTNSAYVSKILKSDSEPLPDNFIHQIADDPYLTGPDKENLAKLAETHMTGLVDKDAKTYGDKFYDVYRRIHLPDDDPQRITDPSDLYAMVGKGLLVAGVDKGIQEISGRKTVGGEAESAMKKSALEYAKRQMSFEMEIGNFKLPDKNGMAAFNTQFIPAFYDAYDKARAAGKTPYQLLSKDSKDFIVDDIIGAYKRSDAQYHDDYVNAAGDLADKTIAPATAQVPDLTTPDGLKAAVRAGKIPLAEAIRIGRARGWVAPEQTAPAATSPPREVPIPVR